MNRMILDTGRIVAALLAAALSCSCETLPERAPSSRELSFSVCVPGTRAAVTPHEADVQRLDVLVFRSSDGILDASGTSTGTGTVTASVTPGVPMRWYIVANAPAGALSSFVTESSFLAGSTPLSHTTASSLVMHAGGTISAGTSPGHVKASLDRYCCKVSVGRLSVRWLDAFSTAPAVRLERVVLVNAVGSTPWSGIPASGPLWYNRLEVDEALGATERDLLVCTLGSRSIPDSQPVTLDCALYCMPNPTDNGVNSAANPSWSPRNTRVAIELTVDGQPNWYPVDLPAMEGNHHYRIDEMTILGPGSQGPDYPVTRSEATFSVSVVPWGEEQIPAQF